MNRAGFAVGVILGAGLAGAKLGSLVQQAPATAARVENPFRGDQRAERAGAKLYARECASCHGLNREGRNNAPPLDLPEIYRSAPGTLFWVLRNGSLRRGMPSFAHLPEPQRWQIVTFLQNRATRH
ncbi:MAG: cytochrome c [Acidobacteriia bacterium]|nr:cytochrome c [Terriglobia bacterium]